MESGAKIILTCIGILVIGVVIVIGLIFGIGHWFEENIPGFEPLILLIVLAILTAAAITIMHFKFRDMSLSAE